VAAAHGLDRDALLNLIARWDAAALIVRRRDSVLALATLDDATLAAIAPQATFGFAPHTGTTTGGPSTPDLEAA
jgi:hypothetical protein